MLGGNPEYDNTETIYDPNVSMINNPDEIDRTVDLSYNEYDKLPLDDINQQHYDYGDLFEQQHNQQSMIPPEQQYGQQPQVIPLEQQYGQQPQVIPPEQPQVISPEQQYGEQPQVISPEQQYGEQQYGQQPQVISPEQQYGQQSMIPSEQQYNQQENLYNQQQQNNINTKTNYKEYFVKKPSSEVNTFTINKGTILFHSSTQKAFDPNNIKLGKQNLAALFTPNFKLSTDQIENCSISKQNSFIHAFEVIEDIKNIHVKLPYEVIDINDLEKNFCTNKSIYNGVGFFYPKNDIEEFNNFIENNYSHANNDIYYSEFLLCNPNNYLRYLYTQRCMSLRHLSDQYRFD